MAKTEKYPVHPDFSHYPYFPFPFNRVALALLNGLIRWDVFRRRGNIKAKVIKYQVKSTDGTLFEVLQFNPVDLKPAEKLPAVVYYHGGAFVLSYASTHLAALDFYAREARCAVFMVDYRLAPQHLFPKGFEDCYAALEWVAANADSLGIDVHKIAVMGDSAGGCLTAGVAQRAKDDNAVKLRGQLLVYPCTDRTCSTYSATTYLKAPLFNGIANKKMWEVYLKNFSGKTIPAYAAPADRKDLSGLAKAYLETAEFDPLCDEGADYAKRLQAAGVPVEFHATKGTVHGYDTVHASAITQDSMKRRVNFLKSIFN